MSVRFWHHQCRSHSFCPKNPAERRKSRLYNERLLGVNNVHQDLYVVGLLVWMVLFCWLLGFEPMMALMGWCRYGRFGSVVLLGFEPMLALGRIVRAGFADATFLGVTLGRVE